MKSLALLLAVAVTGTAVLAQDNPASAPAPANPAANPAGAVKQFIYLAKLPTPAEIISEAQAQGLTVSRIEQGDDRIVVTYQYANGTTQSYAYRLISSVAGETALTATAVNSPVIEKVTVVGAPAPRVVYVEPETVYYSSPRYVRYYDPVWGYPPVSFGINLGWRIGGGHYYGGHHRGGYSHGGHRGGRRH